MPAVKSPRRQPVQARSQARVERIVTAATTLVEDGGVDAATTRAIATAAGVPVATLYQFFADRDAVLDAVLERELEALDRHVAAQRPPATATLVRFIDFAFEVHRAYYRSRPAFARLWFGGRRTPPVEAAVRARGRRLAHQWHAVMVDAGLIAPATDPVVSELAVELGDRVFECAFRREPGAEEAIFAEGKRAVAAYLREHAP
ncbi:MAG TPA: TetR/AcrR family transcriptional regulator [Acidimicrobiia bacterium]